MTLHNAMYTFHLYISLLQDGDFAELPPDVLERLLRRPEDLEEQAVGNIAKYKNKMLRLLEVCGSIFKAIH